MGWGHWLMESSGVSQTQFGGMVTAQYALVISRAIIPFLVLIFVPKGNPTEMTDEFERQNKHLLGEKTSGLVTSDSKKSMNGGGHSNGSANGAPPTEPDALRQ